MSKMTCNVLMGC